MSSSGVDERLELLADERRRGVLEYLRRGRRDHSTVDELVEHLRSDRGCRTDRRAPGSERIRSDLHHRTLPKLDALGVVDWDRRHGEVRYREDGVVESVLDALGEDSLVVEG